jgi:membrane peptidoglycan carboxypeptidase
VRSLKTYQLIRRRRRGNRSGGGETHRSLSGWIVIPFSLFILVLSGILIWVGEIYSSLSADLPSIDRIGVWLDAEDGQLLEPTRFYDRTGKTPISSLENDGIQRRFLFIDPSQKNHFSPQLVRAWVAMQQPDFWTSNGVSSGDYFDSQPGTIAEKLVSRLLMENEAEGPRKAIRMRLLAAQITRKYGTGKVLEWYLNSANFGHLAYSAESAAQLYFGKSASDLNLMESALLVAISESPALNPIDTPANIEELQKEALNRLLLGGVISSDEYIKYLTEKPEFSSHENQNDQDTASFINLVTGQLARKIGRERLERGGLKVITSLDLSLQTELICTLRAQLGRIAIHPLESTEPEQCDAKKLLPSINSTTGSGHEGLNSSGVIYDPQNGEVLAMTGDLQPDGTTNPMVGHSPGSLLSPFVAAAAFARGYSPASMVWDIPGEVGTEDEPKLNPDGIYHGPVSLRTGITNDFLIPIVRIFDEIGGQNLQQLWTPFGLGQVVAGIPESNILFGGGLVTPLQVAQAFGVFAAGGTINGVDAGNAAALQPDLILGVEDSNGSPIPEIPAEKSLSVLSEPLTFLVNHVLSDESSRQVTMGSSNPLEIGRPAGGKAGQTENKDGLWSVGYTPQRVASIWLGQGKDTGNAPLDLKMATGMSHALLQYATRNLPVEDWKIPSGVIEVDVCDPSGELPTKNCPNILKEVFLTGNEPTSTDPLFKRISVNRETGRLATVFTPPELIVEKMYMVVSTQYREWAEKAGFPTPPTEYDTIQAPQNNPGVKISSPEIFAYIRGETHVLGTAKIADFNEYRLEVGQGLNPNQWIQIGGENTPVDSGPLGVWDTTGRDGLYAIRLIVIDKGQQFETTVIQVAVDNTPPLVKVPYPQEEMVIESNGSDAVTLRAEVSDTIGTSRVEWWLDNERIGVRYQEPFVYPWIATPGNHSLLVRAFDLAGNMGESEPVKFSVR